MNRLLIKIFIAKPGKKYFPYWESFNIILIFTIAGVLLAVLKSHFK